MNPAILQLATSKQSGVICGYLSGSPILRRSHCIHILIRLVTTNIAIQTIMKAVLILLVVACAVALVHGDLVCGSDYCKKNPCSTPVAKASCKVPSTYRASHAGKCACCPACVSYLGDRQACKTYSKELGETPSAVCREPLKCLKGVCTSVAPRR